MIEALKHWEALRDGDPIMTERLAAIPPETVSAATCAEVSTRVREALERLSRAELYEHQARAITAAMRGATVVLQAPTASGKSLAFQVPMIRDRVRPSSPRRVGRPAHPRVPRGPLGAGLLN